MIEANYVYGYGNNAFSRRSYRLVLATLVFISLKRCVFRDLYNISRAVSGCIVLFY